MSGGTPAPSGSPPLLDNHVGELALVISSAILLITSVIIIILSKLADRRAKAAVDKAAFDNAIASDDLDTLGSYLKLTLGTLTINAYADSDGIRHSTRVYLRRLREYVNPPEQASDSAENIDILHTNEEVSQLTQLDKSALSTAEELLDENKDWTAFASLRRKLEMAFREKGLISGRRSLPLASSISPDDIRNAYGIFLRTANRSIHGESVTEQEKRNALLAASHVFANLDKVMVNPTSSVWTFDKSKMR